jgi:hypothetical protein
MDLWFALLATAELDDYNLRATVKRGRYSDRYPTNYVANESIDFRNRSNSSRNQFLEGNQSNYQNGF